MTAHWMNLKDASIYTGLSTRTLERATASRKLRCGGVPGRNGRLVRRFTAEQLDAFLLSGGKVARQVA